MKGNGKKSGFNSKEKLIENLVAGISPEEHEKIRQEALEKAKNTRHVWRQQGFWLVCRSCPYPHSSWIGPNKRMIGESEDGSPIFE